MTSSHAVLSDNDRKEDLSFTYLSALSAFAGFTCDAIPRKDRRSIDAIVGGRNTQINVQLKSTSSPNWHADGLHFQLPRNNYDSLRNSAVPAILVVFELPTDEQEWLDCNSDRLIMRKCAWWLSLKGYPEVDTASRVVIVPRSQLLNVDELNRLVELASEGRL